MSDRIRISDGSLISAARSKRLRRGRSKLHGKAPGFQVTAELLAEQCLDIGLVIDDEYVNAQFVPPACDLRRRPRQRNNEFGKCARLGIDVDLAAVLFHDDVVAHRQAKSGALARGLGGEEGIEHLLLHFRGDSGAVVANPDFDPVAEVFGGRAQRRLEAVVAGFLALGGGVKAVGNQIEKHPRDLLRIKVDHAGGGIEVALERDVEAGFFRPRAVIGEIEAFLDDRVDIGGPMFARALARMQQHVLDDRIGALAVLHHLFEIALQHMREFVDLLPRSCRRARPA